MGNVDFEQYDVEADAQRLESKLAEYSTLSTTALGALNWDRDIRYGDHADERFDVATAAAGADAPVVVFFHGGWWRSGRKEDRAFLAPPVVEAGAHFVNVEYPLAPGAELSEIVAAAQRAVCAAIARIERSGSTGPIILAGNSAGAHLATWCASVPGLHAAGVPPSRLVGLVAVSGLFDLVPLLELPPNGWLRLDREAAEQLSLIHADYPDQATLRLLVGADEPAGFIGQTRAFAEAATGFRDRRLHVLPDEDHLGIIAQIPGAVKSLMNYKFDKL